MRKKRGLIIGASGDAIHMIETAKKMGIYVLAMDGNPEAKGLSAADEKIVVDISDEEKVCKIVSDLDIDFTLPVPLGRYLATMGAVNEIFHLPGIKKNPIIYSVDKFSFHEKLREKQLRNIKCTLFNRHDQRENLTNSSFPLMIKPRYGSGSKNIHWIETQENFLTVLDKEEMDQDEYIIETAVNGQEYGVDGAVIHGETIVTLIRKKEVTPLPIRQAVASFSINRATQADLYQKVSDYLAKVSDALGYDNCLINADIIVKDNDIFLVEIAPRPAGHSLQDAFIPLSTGIDLCKEYCHFLLGQEANFYCSSMKTLAIHFFNFENITISKVPAFQELSKSNKCHLLAWNCNIQEGAHMEKVVDGASIMGRGYFIVEGKDENDLNQQCEWILKQFNGA